MSRRRRSGAVLAVAAVLGLTGCGGNATADDLAASRAAVIEAAQQDVPGIVEALGGEIQDSWGEWNSGGDGIVDRRRYAVTVVLTVGAVDAPAVVAAFEEAGWSDVAENSLDSIYGSRDDLEISTSTPTGSEMRIGVRGPYLEVADGVPREAARQDVGLG